MNEPTKDLQVGDTRYQLGRFTPDGGNWIIGQFLARGLLSGAFDTEERPEPLEKRLALALSLAFTQLSEDVYNSIQTKCFAVCKRYERNGDAQVAMPLRMLDGSGRWTGKEPDAVTASCLMMATLTFNLACFFGPSVLSTLKEIYPDLNRLASSTQTGS